MVIKQKKFLTLIIILSVSNVIPDILIPVTFLAYKFSSLFAINKEFCYNIPITFNLSRGPLNNYLVRLAPISATQFMYKNRTFVKAKNTPAHIPVILRGIHIS